MPTPCNLMIAEYPGSSEKEGREDTIDIFEIEHHIHQPCDMTTGQATGVRVHSPIRVVAQVDKAMPGLHKAMCTGQNLAEVVLDFWRIDPTTRSETKYFTITLRQARIRDWAGACRGPIAAVLGLARPLLYTLSSGPALGRPITYQNRRAVSSKCQDKEQEGNADPM